MSKQTSRKYALLYTKIGIETVWQKLNRNTVIWPFILILWVGKQFFFPNRAPTFVNPALFQHMHSNRCFCSSRHAICYLKTEKKFPTAITQQQSLLDDRPTNQRVFSQLLDWSTLRLRNSLKLLSQKQWVGHPHSLPKFWSTSLSL